MQDFQKTIELFIDYLKGVWVKKRYVMLCSWLICPIGFIYIASLPDEYESKARVYVDTRSVLQPLLRGLAIQNNPQEEISMMVKTLLSRPNIEAIAREADLDIKATTPAEYEKLITDLSANIKLRSAGRDNLYTISYTHTEPNMARTIVQETLDLFVEGTKGNSRKGTDTANQFIDDQIAEYESRLVTSEQRLADFKRKYADLLPNKGSFYQNYEQLEQSLEETNLTIKETEQKIKALTGDLSKSNGDSSVRSENSAGLVTRYDSRIESLESTLDQLMLKYTELHPDVIETTNLLNSLKAARKKEVDEYLASGNTSTDQIGSIASELKLEVTRLESVIASLQVRKTDYENKIADLKQKIDLVPQVEAELTALNRDYGITKNKHLELLSRKDSAELAQKADVSSEDVQFRVIDPPLAPQAPSGPNRLMSYTAILFVGFAAGLGLAFLISQLNPVLVRGQQLTNLTGFPVLGAVSHLNKEHLRKVNRTRLLVFLLSSGTIFALYLGLVTADLMHVNIYTRFFS
ncbi:MAG: chain-length determining protein [Paraglaciecola sp.]|nr:chain-length determining protein [Paraglaciecola sp.]NCT48863.1 chain-length determining protein [Paraglaciecola sp.]